MREIVHVQAGQCGNQVRVGYRCGWFGEPRARFGCAFRGTSWALSRASYLEEKVLARVEREKEQTRGPATSARLRTVVDWQLPRLRWVVGIRVVLADMSPS